jgi:uncharacterized protein
MHFYRKALKYLKDWKAKSNPKPLLIRGARQVGKSTLVKQFSDEFDHYLPVNLEKNRYKSLFE